LPEPKIRPCSYLVHHDPNLNFPLSLHDRTPKNKCLDNFFAGPKVYSGLKKPRVMSPSRTKPLLDWRKLISQIPVCLFLKIAMLFYQPNLGKTCPIIFLSLMPLVSSYLSKAYQLNLLTVFPPYLIDTNP
jgi:hypothetical protein